MADTSGGPIKRTEQEIQNYGFDETFNQPSVEMIGYDGTVLRRVKVDTDGNLVGTLPTGASTSDNQTNGTQKTQIVDAGGEAVTVTGGKLDVNATITAASDTTGLATSAKQDAILTELQLKADVTETQPVSLASVPSHPVTNTGTFAVQQTNTLITTAFDYIGVSYPDASTEVYTYKIGGATGTTVGTITVVYSDAVTKQIITSVTKT